MKRFFVILVTLLAFVSIQVAVNAQEMMGQKDTTGAGMKKSQMMEKKATKMEHKGMKMEKKATTKSAVKKAKKTEKKGEMTEKKGEKMV
jgi:hypothetical protein